MSTATAQVPPSIAAALRRIGLIVDVPNTRPLYEPLFVAQRETYSECRRGARRELRRRSAQLVRHICAATRAPSRLTRSRAK